MSRQSAELHIPVKEPEFEAVMIITPARSASDDLRFAKAGACEITFVEPEDDDQAILSVQDVQEYYQRFREMRAESEAMDRELIDRIERVLEANDGRI